MTTHRQRQAVDRLAATLSALSSDHTRSTGYYGNVIGVPGPNNAPRRIISSFGFLQTAQYQLVAPNAAHVSRGETDRPCALIRLMVYGLREDAAVLLNPSQENRRRVGLYALRNVSLRTLDDPDKTIDVVNRMTGTQGPAYHFIIDRSGSLYVGATLDDVVDPASPLSIDIALEGAFVAPEKGWDDGRVESLIELPLPFAESDTLRTLIAKIWTAYPGMRREFSPTGIVVVRPELPPQAELFNFTDGAWRDTSPFDHSESDSPSTVGAAISQLNFDLATDVFVTPGGPRLRAVRGAAAAAVYQVDTVGARSMMLGHYAELASLERSQAMQTTSRREFFVQRIAGARDDAAGAANSAAHAAGANSTGTAPQVTNVDPFKYDFVDGRWQDGDKSVY